MVGPVKDGNLCRRGLTGNDYKREVEEFNENQPSDEINLHYTCHFGGAGDNAGWQRGGPSPESPGSDKWAKRRNPDTADLCFRSLLKASIRKHTDSEILRQNPVACREGLQRNERERLS